MPKFDVNAQVTNRLKFKPTPEFNNICVGRLIRVDVTESKEIASSEKGYEYGGFKIPMLEFEFTQFKTNDADPDRFYTHRFTPIVSKRNDGSAIDADQVVKTYQDMWFAIKHIHDAYITVPNFRAFAKIPDINENGTPEEKIAQTKAFFTTIADFFNKGKDDKPIYKDAAGVSYLMAMKLIADYTTGKYLTFPTFVGEGFIERAIPQLDTRTKVWSLKTTLEIKATESVELRDRVKKGGGVDAASPTGDAGGLTEQMKKDLGIS